MEIVLETIIAALHLVSVEQEMDFAPPPPGYQHRILPGLLGTQGHQHGIPPELVAGMQESHLCSPPEGQQQQEMPAEGLDLDVYLQTQSLWEETSLPYWEGVEST